MQMKFLAKMSRYSLWIVLLVIIVFTAIANPRFLIISNLMNVLLQVSVLGVVALGATFIVISGGIDLSVGRILSVSAYVAGLVIASTGSTLLGIVVALVVGTGLGAFNGLLVASERADPFIITLGTMTLFEGVAIVISHGSPINSMGALYDTVGRAYLFGVIPVPIVLFLVGAILVAFFLRKTPLGRYAYAIGGNEQAVRLAGINVARAKILLYTLNGLLSGAAAILLSSILDSALPFMGSGYELRAIAAVVIGGTPLSGGKGSVLGTIAGVLLLGLVSNSINMIGISANFQNVFLGAIIVVAVLSQKR